MNAKRPTNLQIDFRTGLPTSFHGNRLSESEWIECAFLNRKRSSRIKAAGREIAPRESIPPDVWLELVRRDSIERESPVVPLAPLGIRSTELGFFVSDTLKALDQGKEATAWLDEETLTVYKLFDLRADGRLGEKINIQKSNEFEFSVNYEDARLPDILDKLEVIHEMGGCPTEIMGLADTGDFLVAKQPYCNAITDFSTERKIAVRNAKSVPPTLSGGQELWITWAANRAWGISDLHSRNIRRSASGEPVIIDCHTGTVPEDLLRIESIARAVGHAHKWRTTGIAPRETGLPECNDAEL